MQTDIIPIGNSRGIRIPKAVLEQCGLSGRVEMKVKNGTLIISPLRKAREGWAESVKQSLERYGPEEPLWPEDMQDDYLEELEWPESK